MSAAGDRFVPLSAKKKGIAGGQKRGEKGYVNTESLQGQTMNEHKTVNKQVMEVRKT